MPQVQVVALVGHSTHDDNGQPVWHDAGTTYSVDASVLETLEGIGFARLSKVDPDPVQFPPKKADDDHTVAAMTTGPEPPLTPRVTSPPPKAPATKRK